MTPYQKLADVDRRAVLLYLDHVSSNPWRRWHRFCRWIGLPGPLTGAYALIAVYAYWLGGWKLVFLEMATIILINVLNLGLKRTFRRERPRGAVFDSPLPYDHYSFPSGHAATAMAIAAALSPFSVIGAPVLMGWALFLGASRFFGELHYPSDIVVGLAVGAVGGTLIRLLFLVYAG